MVPARGMVCLSQKSSPEDGQSCCGPDISVASLVKPSRCENGPGGRLPIFDVALHIKHYTNKECM